MKYGFETKDGDLFEFNGVLTLSVGDGLELDSRYSYDASKRPQSIVRRRRNTAKTATVQISINGNIDVDLFTETSKYETIAGALGTLVWAENSLGFWCVQAVSISFAIDAIDVASSAQISLSLTEGYEAKPLPKVTQVRLM